MIDKVFETITYIKTNTQKKPSIDRIKRHLLRAGDESNEFSVENLENLLQDMCDKGIIELVDGALKNEANTRP